MARVAGSGRKKGTPNRRTQEVVAGIEATGLTPLAYLLAVMRDERNDIDKRMDAAKAAAPFVHAKLSAIDARIAMDGQIVVNINKPG